MANYKEDLKILSFDPSELNGKTTTEITQRVEKYFHALIEKKKIKYQFAADNKKSLIVTEIARIEKAYIDLCMNYDMFMDGMSFHERAFQICTDERYMLSKIARCGQIINIATEMKQKNPKNKAEIEKEMKLFNKKIIEPMQKGETLPEEPTKTEESNGSKIVQPQEQEEAVKEEEAFFIEYTNREIMTLSNFINLARVGKLSYQLEDGQLAFLDSYAAYLPGTSTRENPDLTFYANLDRKALRKGSVKDEEMVNSKEDKWQIEEQRKEATEFVVEAIRREVTKDRNKEVPVYFGDMKAIRLKNGNTVYEFLTPKEQIEAVERYEQQKKKAKEEQEEGQEI